MRTPVETLATALRRAAETGVFDGRREADYFDHCRRINAAMGVQAIFTRDVGHHTSGWWKNPDYERCYHLSLSFFDPETRSPAPRNRRLTDALVAAVFGRWRRWLWCEPPYSPEGRRKDVWHYRLFCDAGWAPLKPRGEVYSRELTEAGWLSWSDWRACLSAEGEGAVLLHPANNPRPRRRSGVLALA